LSSVHHFTISLLVHLSLFSFHSHLHIRALHSFPTRRSSDLAATGLQTALDGGKCLVLTIDPAWRLRTALNLTSSDLQQKVDLSRDRKSTRLNSSHVAISYAVFCLKKKKKNIYVCELKYLCLH